MTTKSNPFIVQSPLVLKITSVPGQDKITIQSNRPAPTIQLLAMLLDATPMVFKMFCEQQAGIVGGAKIPVEGNAAETPTEPTPEKVV